MTADKRFESSRCMTAAALIKDCEVLIVMTNVEPESDKPSLG
ncbi:MULTISPECIES: hypothetical protein [unclassified Mesorhizobium]|nr:MULTISPECIES: hypothetical protein [unclassified Mesorhizobium]